MDLDPVLIPDGGDDIACPMPCDRCQELGPDGCEDCVDCLLWPEVVPPRALRVPAPPGPTAPTMSTELQHQRKELDIGARVGLVSRRFRSEQEISQRGLARPIGWSQASLNRAEQDAAPVALHKIEALLRHVGYRLAIVPIDIGLAETLGEDRDERGVRPSYWPRRRRTAAAATWSGHVELPSRQAPVRAGPEARSGVDLGTTLTPPSTHDGHPDGKS